METEQVNIRYIVEDVDAAIEFYMKMLDFKMELHPASEFAVLAKGNLKLLLSRPLGEGGGGKAMPDGAVPSPGGWNRFAIVTQDLESKVNSLKTAGCKFRNEIVTGVGGRQILLMDPSGNLIELFEPKN
jgi:predicted enzyme related to lactoylglutathione lyase